MIAWLLKKLRVTAPAPQPIETPRTTAPEDCALWHDVVRALDAKPKAVHKGSAK